MLVSPFSSLLFSSLPLPLYAASLFTHTIARIILASHLRLIFATHFPQLSLCTLVRHPVLDLSICYPLWGKRETESERKLSLFVFVFAHPVFRKFLLVASLLLHLLTSTPFALVFPQQIVSRPRCFCFLFALMSVCVSNSN